MEQLASRRHDGSTGEHSDSQRLTYLLAFYLGIPVALALYSGASESGSAAFVAKRYYFLYFLSASIPVWLAFDLCTRSVKWVLKPWQPPLLLILILGAILGLHLQGLWTPWRHAIFEPYLAEGSRFYPVFPWRYGDVDYLVKAAIAWSIASAVWAGANIFFMRVFGLPRYGHRVERGAVRDAPDRERRTADKQAPASQEPPTSSQMKILLDKLPEGLGTDIVALKAEEHYTRVFTTSGESLILMRFSDAVDLLSEMGGLQTHRSYWVNRNHVESLVNEGRSDHLHLSTGLDIPVSRTYRVKVRETLAHADDMAPEYNP